VEKSASFFHLDLPEKREQYVSRMLIRTNNPVLNYIPYKFPGAGRGPPRGITIFRERPVLPLSGQLYIYKGTYGSVR